MVPFDDDFCWEYPDDQRECMKEEKRRRKKKSTSVPQSAPKAKSTPNTSTNSKPSKDK